MQLNQMIEFSGKKEDKDMEESVVGRPSDLSASTYSQIVSIADIEKIDLNALVQQIVQEQTGSPEKPVKAAAPSQSKWKEKLPLGNPFKIAEYKMAEDPAQDLPMSLAPFGKQSSSGAEEATTLNDAGPAMTSANIHKSTTGKSTNSSGKDPNYVTLKEIPADLQMLDVDKRKPSKDTNCDRMSQRVYPGDQLLN